MSSPLYARATDNILNGAVITSTVTPVATYSLTTLALMNPAARVVFGSKTLTITFTLLSGAAAGAILVIPMHNLVGAVLTLTNGAGYSHAITPPAVGVDGYPPPLVIDLSAFSGTLTSNVWHLVIVNNPDNVVLGGAVGIYPKRTFADISANSEGSFTGDFFEVYKPKQQTIKNEYGTRYVQEYDAVERSIGWRVIGPNTGILLARDWFLANRGAARPGPFWPYPDEPTLGLYGPMFGTWQEELRIEPLKDDTSQLTAVFDEWARGQVIP